jgi:hypothetical protein
MLYLVSNNKDNFKVGITLNIEKRIETLNTASALRPFNIIKLFYTDCYKILETTIKHFFSKYRLTVSNEFYKIEIKDRMINFINNYVENYNNYKDCSLIEDEDTLECIIDESIIPDNKKICSTCDDYLELNNFFRNTDQSYFDSCIVCYEKINKNGTKCKQCKDCKEIKFTYEFDIERTSKDGLSGSCKTCKKVIRVEKKDERKNIITIGKKECITCKKFDYLKMFFLHKKENNINTYLEQCKECYCKEHGDSKQCSNCQDIKSIGSFSKASQNTDGLSGTCKLCVKNKNDERIKNIKYSIIEDPTKNKRKCLNCEQYLEYKLFFKNFLVEDEIKFKYHDKCKECYTLEIKNEENEKFLQCNKCHDIKEINYFGIDLTKTTGRRTICKDCTNERDRKNRLKNKN